MSERLVRLGHPVYVFALGHRGPFTFVGVENLLCQELAQRLAFFPSARVADPAERQRLLPLAIHGHGHLIVTSPDAFGSHFDIRLAIAYRLLEHDVRRLETHFGEHRDQDRMMRLAREWAQELEELFEEDAAEEKKD